MSPRVFFRLVLLLLFCSVCRAGEGQNYRDYLRTMREAPARTTRSITVPPGYRATALSLPIPSVSGAIIADPNDSNVFYISGSSFSPFSSFRAQDIYRLELSAPGAPVTASVSLVSAGSVNAAGAFADADDVLDNHFGGISMAAPGDGRLLVVDNDFGTTSGLTGVIGDTIIELEDRDADGDFRDIVGGNREAREFADPIEADSFFTPGDFGGAQATCDAGGNLYVVTADGLGLGEVIRVADDASTQTLYFDGLDFGGGAEFAPSTGEVLFGQSVLSFLDFSSTGTLYRARDLNADNDAMDAGETVIINDTLAGGVYDLTFDGDQTIYATINETSAFPAIDQIAAVNINTGVTTVFTELPGFAVEIAFDSSASSFAPGAANGRRLLVANYPSDLTVIEPDPAAAVGRWEEYERWE